jgi:hypothetical protein
VISPFAEEADRVFLDSIAYPIWPCLLRRTPMTL